jgi:Fe2+ or Zn2+ uptake regulation protein
MNGNRDRPSRTAALLRERGNRVTLQRRAILKIIEENGKHLSADEIFYLARRQVPRLSLSTVYRTLDLLKELDLVSELRLGADHHHYEAQSDQHQHLVCLGCGEVIEFQCGHRGGVHEQLAHEYGFEITGSRVELLGYCEACAKARSN